MAKVPAAKDLKWSEMVQMAIESLKKKKKGSSMMAINNYITATYNLEPTKVAIMVKQYLSNALSNGKLIRTRGVGLSGSFKIPVVKNSNVQFVQKSLIKKKNMSKVKAAKNLKYSEMVQMSIESLTNGEGASMKAINNYITATYNLEPTKVARMVKKYLSNAIANGELIQTTGLGLRGTFKTPVAKNFNVTESKKRVIHIEINHPKSETWTELGKCFNELNKKKKCVIVLSAVIDLKDVIDQNQKLKIKEYQEYISSLELCRKPVIAAVHNACIGTGIDLISTADIRYCSKDAWFQINKEHIGVAMDVGTLQRISKVVGNQSWVRELCFTGRKFDAAEALEYGFVSKVFDTKEDLLKSALDLAVTIAANNLLTVQKTKEIFVRSTYLPFESSEILL